MHTQPHLCFTIFLLYPLKVKGVYVCVSSLVVQVVKEELLGEKVVQGARMSLRRSEMQNKLVL